MPIETTAARLRRAVALGHELHGIAIDPQLHSLSREAWDRHARDLGGFRDDAALQAAIEKLETRCPHLAREVRARARLWVRDPIDAPGPYLGFGAEYLSEKPYAEMLHSGLSVDALSAIAAIWCAEMRPPATFGKLDAWQDLQRLEEPRQRELGELDAVLATTVRLSDVSWHGGKPFLEHAGVRLELGEHNVGCLASELALAVGRMAPAPGPAVPVA